MHVRGAITAERAAGTRNCGTAELGTVERALLTVAMTRADVLLVVFLGLSCAVEGTVR